MKQFTIPLMLCAILSLPTCMANLDAQPLVLTNIVNAQIQRFDDGPNVRIVITLNLINNLPSVRSSFYLDEGDIGTIKNGTAPQKAAILKACIRRAIMNYLAVPAQPPDPVVEVTVSKAQIQDAGDTP